MTAKKAFALPTFDVLLDAVETAMTMGLFRCRAQAAEAALFHGKPGTWSTGAALRNMDMGKLGAKTLAEAYPAQDPRDVKSTQYWMQRQRLTPIVIGVPARRSTQCILLDGTHRLVAAHLSGRRTVPCFFVPLS